MTINIFGKINSFGEMSLKMGISSVSPEQVVAGVKQQLYHYYQPLETGPTAIKMTDILDDNEYIIPSSTAQ